MASTEVEDGAARVDPDTALSYIDERLQRALGHFQKEFEGSRSAESLGPRYGGYGSFLPSYKLPPPVHHSHSKGPNPNKSSPLNSFRLEGAPAALNPVTFADPIKPAASQHKDVFVDQNVSSADNMASKDTCFIKRETPRSNLVNPTEQRSLKVRIKVGLGLLTPSSSTGNNVEDSGGPPIESRDVLFNSPSGILGDMTSIFVPGNKLVSPLNESLMCLKVKVKPVVERKTSFSVVEDDKAPVSEKGIKTESAVSKQGLTSGLKVKLSSDSTIPEAKRAAKKDVPLKKRETRKEPINVLSFGPESCEQKNVKKLSSDSIISEPNRVAKKDVPLKKRETQKELLSDPDVTRKESDESFKQKNVKKLSLDSRGIRQIACKNDPDALKHEPQEVKIPKNIATLPSERKNKLKDVQTKEILRSSLPGSMKNKKSALKDIVEVRNSYKDIFDTNNRAIEVANVGRNEISAEVAVPQQTEVGPAASLAEVAVPQQIGLGPAVPPDNWVGCDRCEKWRLLPIGIEPDNLPDKWLCSMSTWLPGRNHCDISEDETTRAVQEMNLQLISQNQNCLQYNVIRGDIGNSDHTNSDVNSETMTTKIKKIKSKPEGSSSILIETNQPLVEKNDVVKAKRLINKTWSDQHETKDKLVVSVKIHTEDTTGSIKSESFDKTVEVPAKKRKLKDWQESQSQPYANTLESSEDRIKLKDKRLKTELKESTDDVFFNKGKTMKIKLSATKENSVDTSHEKLLDKKVEIPAKKRKLKDWQESQSQPYANALECSEDRIKMKDKRLRTGVKESADDMSFVKGKTMKIKLSDSKENSVDTKHEQSQQHREKTTTSSSSKISGSSRRASLQERKGSPVGSVSSFSISAPNPYNNSPASGKTIPRKAHARTEIPRKNIDTSQRSGGKVDVKHKEASKTMSTKGDANGVKDKDQRSNSQRTMVRALTDSLTGQPNKMRRVEVDLKHAGSEEILGDMGSPEMNPTVKKDLKKVKAGDMSNVKDPVEPKVELQTVDSSGQNKSKVMKHPGDAANQNAINDLSVISFLKEYSSGQSALTPFRRAEESKDYADRLKISGFDYECNDAYFDSALKFLYASSLLETCTADISKSKGVDPVSGYTTSAKLSKICAQEYEKRKEYAAASLAYKCMEVACMRIVYCKSLLTRQDLQTSMQMVTQGESPSSSVSDVDNLNNQATMDKTMLSKNIAHPGNQLVVKNQANLMRLLDLTSDVSFAMEASTKSQNAYKAASAILEESKNEMMISVKRVVDFSFQDVKEIVCLVQNTREAINRQGIKGNNRR
ncbi:cysteine-tryptophan domain-containing zinc finger protein 3-like isoform X2 [Bidens hawaiensis]|uniref:cysteine-tryptophan domain-containing zinc finger protein 3-like isoform X2 n=1 Tax=Bidens hawaiensis TaxID=980011 RepID=UPI004049B6E8